MHDTFGQCSLYLHSDSSNYTAQDITALLIELQNIHLISNKIKEHDTHYHAGENFLDYIAYMGCAPAIQFETSEDNKKFCYIKVHFYQDKKLISSKVQAKPPQCPTCKKPVKNWQEVVTEKSLFCENCNSMANIEEYNWRRMGGYAQLFIEITDIFPKEAIPQQSLLDKLSKITHSNWQYFYSCR